MMKNTEWGEVTSASLDGTYNTNYFNKASVIASTTNNYTGIYDMSAGAWEYMISGMDDNSTSHGKTGKLFVGRNNAYESGFIGKLTCPECNEDAGIEVNHNILEIAEGIALPTDERYYDKYEYDIDNFTYKRGKLGDATKEMGPFQSMTYLTQSRAAGSWYDDEIWIVYSGAPWVIRGGHFGDGNAAGMFSFGSARGNSFGQHGFRLVLAF